MHRGISFFGLCPFQYRGLDSPKRLSIEYRTSNTEPQKYEVSTSEFDIPCSIFCGFHSTLGIRKSSPQGEGFHAIIGCDNKIIS
jgi:hypothetical protein